MKIQALKMMITKNKKSKIWMELEEVLTKSYNKEEVLT